jgi:hypothetical protein
MRKADDYEKGAGLEEKKGDISLLIFESNKYRKGA